MNINGMICEINISSIGHRLSNSSNSGQNYILFFCACIGILFFSIDLWQLLHIQSDLPVENLSQISD